MVLDVSRANGIVDLSLQPGLLQRAEAAAAAAAAQAGQPPKKKAKGKKGAAAAAAGGGEAAEPLREGQQLTVTIELVGGPAWGCFVYVAGHGLA